MYLDSTTSTLNATLTKAGELQALNGILKYLYFSIGDSEVDYRLDDTDIERLLIMEASTYNNQSKHKIIRDADLGTTAPAIISVSLPVITASNGEYYSVTISSQNTIETQFNIYNPRYDLITLFGNGSSINGITQTITVTTNNVVNTDQLSVKGSTNQAVFILKVNTGLPIDESIILNILGINTGASTTITVNIEN